MSGSSGERVDTEHTTKSAWHKWARESVQKYTYQNKMNVPDGITYHSVFKFPNKKERDGRLFQIIMTSKSCTKIRGLSGENLLLLEVIGAPLCPVNEAIS